MDQALRDHLLLALTAGVGPRLHRQLCDYFGSASEVLAAPLSALVEVEGIGPKLAGAIRRAADEIDLERELQTCAELGIELLTPEDPGFPRLLAEIPDPPPVLFLRGKLTPADQLSLAVVGTRHATTYGLQAAEQLAAGLARAGLTVVSGLARGIDAAAHRGALAAEGRTLAVLAGGLREIYPPEHRDLAENVAPHGALLSEAPPSRQPRGGSFHQRNRIISGISLGVLVVEAADRSGALITARHAMEQNREVMAVPGRIDSRQSRGCHRLLRDGAVLVETVDDILEALGPLVEGAEVAEGLVVRRPAELQLNEQEQQVLQAIGSDPTALDEVAVGSGLPIHRVLATVSVLEMKRLIRRIGGNQVARV